MQYIGKPVFFTDFCSLQQQAGINDTPVTISGLSLATGSIQEGLCDNNPSNTQTITANTLNTTAYLKFDDEHHLTLGAVNSGINCLQILGHNFHQSGVKFSIESDDNSGFSSPTTATIEQVYGSGSISTNIFDPNMNGSTILKITNTTTDKYWRIKIEVSSGTYSSDIKIGSIRFGSMITSPSAVNISEKQESITKFKRYKSLGGNNFRYKLYQNDTWYLGRSPFYNDPNITTRDMSTIAPEKKKYTMDFSYVSDSNFKTQQKIMTQYNQIKLFHHYMHNV